MSPALQMALSEGVLELHERREQDAPVATLEKQLSLEAEQASSRGSESLPRAS